MISNPIPLRRADSRPQDYARHADGKGQKDTDRWLRSQNQRADKWNIRDRQGDRSRARKRESEAATVTRRDRIGVI